MNISLLKKLLYTSVTVLFAALAGACSSSDEPAPVPDPDPVETTANRTILVYMAAANSLGNGFDTADIAEMQEAALKGDLKGNRLILFHQNTAGVQALKEIDPETGEVKTLTTYDNTVSALSTDRMKQVIADTKTTAPANDFGLILWSHANGWLVMNSTPESNQSDPYSVSPLAFGEDNSQSPKVYMNIHTLASTLRGQDFSFVYFDCCYMACVEVLYEMTDVTPYVVASTAEVIAEGMPYQLSLPYLFKKGEADLKGAVKAVFDYVDAKTDFNRTGTYAVFDMSKIPALAQAAREFYSYRPSAPNSFRPQRYMYESTCYFYDFAHIVENMNVAEPSDDFENARTKLLDAIDESVIYKANTPYIWPGEWEQVAIDHFCGMSSQYLTMPSQATRGGYNETAWWNDIAKYQFPAADNETKGFLIIP